VLDANLGDEGAAVEFNVALTLPVNVKVQLDAVLNLVNVNVAEDQGHGAEVDLLEEERVQRCRQHGAEHWLGDLLDHGAGAGVDVGPQVLDNLIEEAGICPVGLGSKNW